MKGFDITQLQYYYDNKISFKCIDILKWAKSNLDNNNFDIKYAAQDLMNHYFIKPFRRPNNDCYYFISLFFQKCKRFFREIFSGVFCIPPGTIGFGYRASNARAKEAQM